MSSRVCYAVSIQIPFRSAMKPYLREFFFLLGTVGHIIICERNKQSLEFATIQDVKSGYIRVKKLFDQGVKV